MPRYTVYLGNPSGMRYQWQELCEAVHALFAPVLEGMADYEGVRVRSTMTAPALAATELLVYILPSSMETLVSGEFRTSTGPDGLTAWRTPSNLTGSEVYVNTKTPTEVANLVFHEALHNKLHWGDATLHRQGGLAASPVNPPQTRNDIALMKRGLPRAYQQWTGGFAAFNDPLRGL